MPQNGENAYLAIAKWKSLQDTKVGPGPRAIRAILFM